MKKSYFSTTTKVQNPGWHSLFSVLFVFFFLASFLRVQAQCPTITVTPPIATICSGTTTSIALASNQIGTTYTWTIVQDGIVGAADGKGSRISQTLATTEAATGSVVYTITPIANACKGTPISVKFVVNPIPLITASPLSSTIISGNAASMELTSDVAETTFTWTVIQSGVTRAIAGSGSAIRQILTTNADKGIATYRITPNFNGCAGQPINAKVIVKR